MRRQIDGRTWRWLPACAAALALCACGGAGATTAETSATATATASPAPAGASVTEDLTFTGAVSGHLAAGTAGDAYACAATGGSCVAGPILGTLGGSQVELNIV